MASWAKLDAWRSHPVFTPRFNTLFPGLIAAGGVLTAMYAGSLLFSSGHHANEDPIVKFKYNTIYDIIHNIYMYIYHNLCLCAFIFIYLVRMNANV